MTKEEKRKLASNLADALFREKDKLTNLYHEVLADKITTAQFINTLEDVSHSLTNVQNQIEAVTKIKA